MGPAGIVRLFGLERFELVVRHIPEEYGRGAGRRFARRTIHDDVQVAIQVVVGHAGHAVHITERYIFRIILNPA